MKRDLVGVVEAAYRLDTGEEQWLRGVGEAARPLLDQGHGVVAMQLDRGAIREGDSWRPSRSSALRPRTRSRAGVASRRTSARGCACARRSQHRRSAELVQLAMRMAGEHAAARGPGE
jgi:hypothetical protein